MTTDGFEAWASRFMGTVATEIKRHRIRQGLSAQQLSDKMSEEYGLLLKRSVIANLESGRRPTLSLVELFVLARVLKVPPILLVFPLGHQEQVEVLPDQSAYTWEAAKWFMGEGRFPVDNLIPCGEIVDGIAEWYEDPEAGWREDAAPVQLQRQLDDAWQEYFRAPQYVRGLGKGDDESYDLLARMRQRTVRKIRAIRDEMRQKGLTPPPLRDEFTFVDED